MLFEIPDAVITTKGQDPPRLYDCLILRIFCYWTVDIEQDSGEVAATAEEEMEPG